MYAYYFYACFGATAFVRRGTQVDSGRGEASGRGGRGRGDGVAIRSTTDNGKKAAAVQFDK